MIRKKIVPPVATVVATGIVVMVIGFFTISAKALEKGAVLGWDLSIIGVTSPQPALWQYLALLLAALLLVFPHLYAFILHTRTDRARVTCLVTAVLLSVVVLWALLTTDATLLDSGVAELGEGLQRPESVVVSILREAGLSPVTHFLAGLHYLLFFLGKVQQSQQSRRGSGS